MAGSQLSTVLRHLQQLVGVQDAPELPDAELVGRFVRQHDEAAFAALVQRHGGLVLSVCRHVLRHEADAEDAFQATFLILARKASSIRKRTSLASWLHGVAYRTARSFRKSEMRRRKYEQPAAETTVESPVATASLNELLTLLNEEVAALPERWRAPFVLCCLEGKSREEAAQVLGWKEGTVSSRLAHARERLRQRLSARGVTLPAALAALAISQTPASAVPAALAGVTIRATLAFAAGRMTEDISARVIAVAEGVMQAMFLTKFNVCVLVLGLLLNVCLVGVMLAYQPLAEPLPPSQVAEEQPPKKEAPVRMDFFGDPLPEGAVARLGTVRWHAGNRVWALTYSPDGKTLATAGEDHKARLWEAGTGKELHVFPCEEFVGAVAFIPGGAGKPATLLASGSNDKKVRLWNVVTGKQVAEWTHPEGIRALAASPDGKLLAAASEHEIHLWNVAEGKKLRHWTAHAYGVLSLTFTPDGTGLLSGGRAEQPPSGGLRLRPQKPDDYGLALWDPHTGQLRKKFAEHDYEAQLLGVTADGQRWVAAGQGKEGRGFTIWDAAMRRQQVISTKDVEEWLGRFALSPDGKTLAASGSREIYLWDVSSGKRLPPIKERNDYQPLALAFSPDSQTLAASTILARVILWDVGKKSPRHVFPAHDRGVNTVTVAPDGKTVRTGGNDGDIREWELDTGKPLRRFRHEEGKVWSIRCLKHAPDGETLVASYFSGVSIWNLPSGKMVRDIPTPPNKSRIVSMDLSPDGTRVVWQSIDDGDLPLWDLKAGKEIRRLPQGTGGRYFLAYSPTGETIASVTDRLNLWDAETGKVRYEKRLSGWNVTYSPDGLLLALYSEPMRILETATGEELVQIPWRGNHGYSWGLTFSPDGRYLAVTEKENVGIWDVQTRKFVHTFRGHRSWASSLAFTPDGKRLVSGSEDSTAVVWDMNAVPSAKLAAPDFPSLWDELKNADRLQAYAAFQHLRQAPGQAVNLLKTHLQPIVAVDPERVEQLLQDLDGPNFVRREKATAELNRCGDQVEKKLRDLHASTASVELSQRLDKILSKVGIGLETRRRLWSVRLLEMIGTPEACDLLRRMAQGAPAALVTRQAQQALERRKAAKG